MDGRAFLDVAQRLLQAATEADWRSVPAVRIMG